MLPLILRFRICKTTKVLPDFTCQNKNLKSFLYKDLTPVYPFLNHALRSKRLQMYSHFLISQVYSKTFLKKNRN